ncbi:hypothetical protein ACVLVH_004634 [Kluyvera sp. 1366]|jgi:hypothetical protein
MIVDSLKMFVAKASDSIPCKLAITRGVIYSFSKNKYYFLAVSIDKGEWNREIILNILERRNKDPNYYSGFFISTNFEGCLSVYTLIQKKPLNKECILCLIKKLSSLLSFELGDSKLYYPLGKLSGDY